ncbi:MmcQ/YjbR family DNA-binding protein [Pseudorhizobium sp. NPDC055634]
MINRAELFKYAEKKYGIRPDYPFKSYRHYAVLRHGDDDRWFGLVMNVPRERVGLQGKEEIDILDIKCHPAKVDDLKVRPGFRPAYHMNKEHWLTVILDGSVPKQEVLTLLDESYGLTR